MQLKAWASCLAILLVTPTAIAHPILQEMHDRTIVVRLQKTETPNKLRVRVDYRLELHFETVLKDMEEYRDEANYLDYLPLKQIEYYAHFTRIYAPIFIEQMHVEVNKKADKLKSVSRKERVHDEDGKSLNHLRCDLIFEGEFACDPNKETTFNFHDQTYWSGGLAPEKGYLVLSFVNESGMAVETKTVPDAALYAKAMELQSSKEEDRQRKLAIVLAPRSVPAPASAETPPPQVERHAHDDSYSLTQLIFQSDYGFWLTLLLAFFFGAAHALTPGHGKTLVAAYLVGERGTIWHALFLGLVTTLTHTGVVILLAVIMTLLPTDAQRVFQKWIQNGIGLVLGLIVVCMGFWLLLQRISGKADHFHVGGGHHHHGDGTPVANAPGSENLSWWGLVMLGVTGGIVPCWDAIILLFYTVGTSRFWLVLPAVLAFSAGLAMVLVLIGILVVQVPRFVQARGGDGKLIRALPTVSAVAVIAVGLWLCYEWSQGR